MNLFWILVYLGIQLLVVAWVSRRIRSEKDFFLAGRQLPTWLLAFSLFATWFGAETVIGTSAAVYQNGLAGSRADPFGYSLCLVFLGLFLARKLWEGNYTTLADFFRQRFGPQTEKLAIWIIVPSTLLWGAAQMRAFGQIVSNITTWDLSVTLWLAFGFVTLYTLLGGLLGDIITDLIQGLLIALGLLALLWQVLPSNHTFFDLLHSLPAERLHMTLSGESVWQRLDRWAIPILGSLVAQELVARTMAARSARVAQQSAYFSAAIYLLFGSIPVIIGLFGPQWIQLKGHPENFIMELAKSTFSPALFIIFSGSVISAILATIDSILLSCSALISHNAIVPWLGLTTEKAKVRSARLVIVIAALICILLALTSESVYSLVQNASSLGTAGLLVITLLGLHSHWGKEISAKITLWVGLLAVPVFETFTSSPFLLSILTSLLCFMALALWENRQSMKL